MQKKLTITIDEEVYEGLRKTIGPRKISRFVQEIVRPHVVRPNIEAAYAEMAKDRKLEKEAAEWAENTFKDVAHETVGGLVGRVQVVPLTGKTDRVYPSETLVVFDGKESKTIADQLATVSKSRLVQCAGVLSRDDMLKIEEAIKVQLNIF